ncbi:MAG TPA: hypothetical protein VEZ14_12575 [Dehalococcoidia bacterium]|nr:hypothetical protein [Dehalococcoidia bacterium]
MRDSISRTRASGLRHDLSALRRYLWLPVATLAVAVAAALVIGALRPSSGDARFRQNVVVDALPPLFGPPVTPSPFDYARLATSDAVVATVAQQAGVAPGALRPRLTATAAFNAPWIDFRVTGPNALAVARAWQQAFADAAASQTPVIERLLVADYARQLDQARALLQQRAADAQASPNDPVLKAQLTAAQDNYQTASRLSQSYDVVASTMKATALTVTAPHEQSAGVGSTAGRLGAAVAIGLLLGVAGALSLEALSRRRRAAPPAAGEPAPLRPRPERTTTTPR